MESRGSEIFQGYGIGSVTDFENQRVIFVARRERQIIERQRILVTEIIDNVLAVTFLMRNDDVSNSSLRIPNY